jgi:hypothetical protein
MNTKQEWLPLSHYVRCLHSSFSRVFSCWLATEASSIQFSTILPWKSDRFPRGPSCLPCLSYIRNRNLYWTVLTICYVMSTFAYVSFSLPHKSKYFPRLFVCKYNFIFLPKSAFEKRTVSGSRKKLITPLFALNDSVGIYTLCKFLGYNFRTASFVPVSTFSCSY